MKHSVIKILILVLVLSSCSDDDAIQRYNLNTTISPIEGGSVSPSSGTFDSGETFTLIATPSENYDFINWSGDATGTTNTVSVTIDSDKNITATFVKRDTDGDGVADDIDICSDTPSGETVDANGCSSTQSDTDGDGVTDDIDTCSNTPSGEAVDTNGCSTSQKDTDEDGVTDDLDTCTDTPSGESVDSNGCSDSQKDTDGDGVTDDLDICPSTPSGETVGTDGCSDNERDTDGDGVPDILDKCPDTASGANVDSNGCASNQIPNYIPTNGLAAWYPFSGNSNDQSGNANDGTINGPVLTNDRFDNTNAAFGFDGVDDYIEVPDDVSLRPDYISVSVWFKTSEVSIQSLLYKTDLNTAFNEQYSLALNYNSVNQIDCSVKNGNNCNNPGLGWQRNQVTEVVNDDIWHHLVYVYDGNQSIIYIDGANISTQTFASGVIDNCTGSPLLIGRGWDAYEFNGSIDDIAIWNRPLTPAEVTNIYQSSNN
ncbi:LamG-like jellyroll fold domain-containing protein [uncultured Eudoraea sp.]|uniref:LamG-like jellyroll fold domain-containing protein n=1 Tax=uncultured Eudoraea sp. TaxID=1035614 RepID=UPI0026161A08|nr:LamG-like jellyroll fold domain-containing protein [uncultured Eudoraea sp.]